MKILLPFAAFFTLFFLTACGATDTPSQQMPAPPQTLEEKIERIQSDPNLSEERKASAIEILKQQEQAKKPAEDKKPQ